MKRPGAAFFIGAVLAAAICPPAIAQSQEADVNAYIANAPISGLPRGPYSQWTEPQRKMAFGRVDGFCRFLCVDKYSNASFPDRAAAERAAAGAKLCLGACIVNHLPADYPGLDKLKQELRADWEKARQLGSAAPWPLAGK